MKRLGSNSIPRDDKAVTLTPRPPTPFERNYFTNKYSILQYFLRISSTVPTRKSTCSLFFSSAIVSQYGAVVSMEIFYQVRWKWKGSAVLHLLKKIKNGRRHDELAATSKKQTSKIFLGRKGKFDFFLNIFIVLV